MANFHRNNLVIAANEHDMFNILVRMAENLALHPEITGFEFGRIRGIDNTKALFRMVAPCVESHYIWSFCGAPMGSDGMRDVGEDIDLGDGMSVRLSIAPSGRALSETACVCLEECGRLWALQMEYYTAWTANNDDVAKLLASLPEGEYGYSFLDADEYDDYKSVNTVWGMHRGWPDSTIGMPEGESVSEYRVGKLFKELAAVRRDEVCDKADLARITGIRSWMEGLGRAHIDDGKPVEYRNSTDYGSYIGMFLGERGIEDNIMALVESMPLVLDNRSKRPWNESQRYREVLSHLVAGDRVTVKSIWGDSSFQPLTFTAETADGQPFGEFALPSSECERYGFDAMAVLSCILEHVKARVEYVMPCYDADGNDDLPDVKLTLELADTDFSSVFEAARAVMNEPDIGQYKRSSIPGEKPRLANTALEPFGKDAAVRSRNASVSSKGAETAPDEHEFHAIAVLEAILNDIPIDERPRNVTALKEAHPTFAREIEAGIRKKLFTREELVYRGILQPTKAETVKMLIADKKRSMRWAPAVELAKAWCNQGLPHCIGPDSPVNCLRDGVRGIDVDALVELRQVRLFAVDCDALDISDELRIVKREVFAYIYKGQQIAMKAMRPIHDPFFGEGKTGTGSPLERFIGTRVIDVKTAGKRSVAIIEHSFLVELSTATMIYALREAGFLQEADLHDGNRWRARLGVTHDVDSLKQQRNPELERAVEEYRAVLARMKEDAHDEDSQIAAALDSIKEFYDGKVRPRDLSQLKGECAQFAELEKALSSYARRHGTTLLAFLKEREIIASLAGPKSVARAKANVIEKWNRSVDTRSIDELKQSFPTASVLTAVWFEGGSTRWLSKSTINKLEALRIGDSLAFEPKGELSGNLSFAKAKGVFCVDNWNLKLKTAERADHDDYSSDDFLRLASDPVAMGVVDGAAHFKITELSVGRTSYRIEIECFVLFDEVTYRSVRHKS